jgi:hypothetical protein
MAQFNGSLRLPGDSHALAATVHVQEGRLQVASGEHVIGDWDLHAVNISRIPEGIRLAAEGEVLLLDLSDPVAFEQEAAAHNGRAKRSGRAGRPAKAKAEGKAEKATKPPKVKPVKEAKVKPARTGGHSRLDQFLENAKERYGTKLPEWVFTRKALLAAIGVVIVSIVFAKAVSYLLLIAGVIALLTGGVTMLDSVIARRILRHRVTPIQVVIGGGTVFVVGLLVGVVGDKLWG